jgi:hypothetical protein
MRHQYYRGPTKGREGATAVNLAVHLYHRLPCEHANTILIENGSFYNQRV